MTEWKLVPVEPTKEMVSELEFQSGQFSDRRKVLRAVISVAPTPPVMLPPLPEQDATGAWVGPILKKWIEDYARAALAQYGITNQPERRRQEVGEGQPETTAAEQRGSAQWGIPSGIRAPAAPTIHGIKEKNDE